MTTYTFDDNCYSDLHKDTYGFRPSASNYAWWNSASDDEKQAEWNRLIVVLEESIATEEDYERLAMERLNSRIDTLMQSGAESRKQAAEWLVQSLNDEYASSDLDYVDFQFGVKYGTFRSLMA